MSEFLERRSCHMSDEFLMEVMGEWIDGMLRMQDDEIAAISEELTSRGITNVHQLIEADALGIQA